MKEATQIELENAFYTIDGYYNAAPRISREGAFQKAKDEAIRVFKRYLEVIDSMNFEKFCSHGQVLRRGLREYYKK